MKNAFEARVYTHPDGPYWRARFRVWSAAKQQWIWKTQSTKRENKGEAQAVANEYARLARAAAPNGTLSTLTREDVLESLNAILRISGIQPVRESVGWKSYAEAWLDSKRIARQIKPKSLLNFQGHLNRFTKFLPDPEHPLNTITVQLLRKFQRQLLDEGRTGGTVNHILTTLGSIFRQAVAEGYMPRNPIDLLQRSESDRNEREAFTLAEVRQLIDHLTATNQAEWITATLLGVCTGQRLTDCTAALWTQIDRTTSPFWVWNLTQRKTGTKVAIPLVEPLASHLRQLDTGSSLYLCPELQRLPVGGLKGLSAIFIQHLKAAGITGDTIARTGVGRSWNPKTFHSLRHTCNSILANADVSQDVRRLILGHASFEMNSRYTHLQIATSATALSDSIGDALSTPRAKAKTKSDPRQTSRTDTEKAAGAKRSAHRSGRHSGTA